MSQIAQAYKVHLVMVGQWENEILEQSRALFEAKRGPKPIVENASEDRLYGEIGRLRMEIDWFKKK